MKALFKFLAGILVAALSFGCGNQEPGGDPPQKIDLPWVQCDEADFDGVIADLSIKVKANLEKRDSKNYQISSNKKALAEVGGSEKLVFCTFQYDTLRFDKEFLDSTKYNELAQKIDPKKIVMLGFRSANSGPQLGHSEGKYPLWRMLFRGSKLVDDFEENLNAISDFSDFLAKSWGFKS